jgi:hypothetical protein
VNADFVAALIEGFESTLDEVLDRLEEARYGERSKCCSSILLR